MNQALSHSYILGSGLPPPESLHLTPPFTPVLSSILQEWSTNPASNHPTTSNDTQDYSIVDLGDDGSSRFLNEVYRTNFPQYNEPNDAEINRQALELKKRFEMHEQYRKYRDKTREEKIEIGGKNEKKWPEEMELAFFKALIIYPAVGRRGVNCPSGKRRRGRNELIAEAIQRWTGEPCKRKQVSSHIQVLKLKVQNDSFIMRHLSTSTRKESSSYRSRYRQPIATCSHDSSPDRQRSNIRNSSYTSPIFAVPSPTKHLQHINWFTTEFTPDYFEMYVTNASKERLHRFTSFPGLPHLPDLHISEDTSINSGTWEPLGIVLSSSTAPSCPVIYAKASIAPTTTSLPSGAELGIEFRIRTDNVLLGGNFQRFECKTSFFERNKYLESITKAVEYDERSRMLKCVPLGSQFWVRNIKSLTANRKLDKIQPTRQPWSGSQPTHSLNRSKIGNRELGIWNDAEEDTLGYENVNVHASHSKLNGLTAVQEIIASTVGFYRNHKEDCKKRLLILFWHFSLAQEGVPGETTWRHVHFGYGEAPNIQASMTNGFDNLYGDVLLSPVKDMNSNVKRSFHNATNPQPMPMAQLSPLELDFFSQPVQPTFDPTGHENYSPNLSETLHSQQTRIISSFTEFNHQTSDSAPAVLDLPSDSARTLNLHQFATDNILDIAIPTMECSNDPNFAHNSHHHYHQPQHQHHQSLSLSLSPLITHHPTTATAAAITTSNTLFEHANKLNPEEAQPLQRPADTAAISASIGLFDDAATAASAAWAMTDAVAAAAKATVTTFLPSSTGFYGGGHGVGGEDDNNNDDHGDVFGGMEPVMSEGCFEGEDGQGSIGGGLSSLENRIALDGGSGDRLGGLSAAEALQRALGLTRSGVEVNESGKR